MLFCPEVFESKKKQNVYAIEMYNLLFKINLNDK
jgi:hypothetical protein